MSKKLKLPKNSVLIITGPTASGKTDLAIELAKELETEILSADSRQIYKYMDICTAKPNKEQLKNIKHYLIDFLEPNEDYSAGKFAKDAEFIIDNLLKQNKLPIICGGSAFYIKALIEGLFEENNSIDENKRYKIRERLNNELKTFGLEKLCYDLKQIDFESYEKIELDNPQRVIRVLEYFYTNNEKISDAHLQRNVNQIRYNPIYFAIDITRSELYQRINNRCEEMWNSGIVKEYENLINLGYDDKFNSLNTVGYKEVKLYLENKFSNEEALSEFKKNTRRFAKRQMTWFRKNKLIHWIDYKDRNKKETIIEILTNET